MGSSSTTQANLANWICNIAAMLILVVRLACIRYQLHAFDTSAYVILLSLAVLSGRLALEYWIIRDGTVSDLLGTEHPTAAELSKAQTGSILSLIARVLITSFYWLMCSLLLLVYRRVMDSVGWVRVAIRICWGVIATTYIAVILTTFLECRPFHLYWQFRPDPGSCVRAYGQLLVQGISNIVIDIFLIVISIPILRTQIRTFPHNLQLGAMFILGTFCLIVTCVRLDYTFASHSSQNTRTMWAAIQALFAAFVANASSIYGATVLRRRKSASRSRSWYSTQAMSCDSPPAGGKLECAVSERPDLGA